jgi:hypothetical protein
LGANADVKVGKMTLPANVQRIAVLRTPRSREQCVLAVSEGPTEEYPAVDPNHFIAIVAFMNSGAKWHPQVDHVVVSLHGPFLNGCAVFPTAADAIEALGARKAAMLLQGWFEVEFDTLGDPD